jgi:hypothetical protein
VAATRGRLLAEAIHIDDLASPRLPLALRLLNAVGAPFATGLVSLDEERLLAAARRRTGLEDFGHDSFREPLRVLLRSLEDEAQLSVFGRFGVRQLVLQLLSNRLRLEDLVRRHPEILDEPIERPLVIAGLPRTGTTHLHNLISQDPALRSLPYWESLEPVPPAGERPDAAGRDPRVARCEKALDFLHRVLPLFPAMHEMTAEARHEEIQLLAIEFSTMLFESSYFVPGYAAWYKAHDQRPAYRYLRRCLQALQWQRGPKRWVLKSPQHLEQLGPLMEVFPDARVVQTHRDPVRITASLCTMVAYSARMNARRVDPAALGRIWADRIEDLLRGSIEGRRHVPADQIMDVRFHEFTKDDMATVARVMEFADHPLSEQAVRSMRAFLDANPRGRHGAIDYRLEDVGLDPRERREALRFYQRHFELPDE